MDSPELSQRNKKSLQSRYVILRWSFAVLFSVLAFLSLSFMVGFVTVLVGDSSMSSPISVPSQCKIVSSSKSLQFIFDFQRLFIREFLNSYLVDGKVVISFKIWFCSTRAYANSIQLKSTVLGLSFNLRSKYATKATMI